MVILLSNDDGINAEGIRVLEKHLSEHDLWIVAPDGERSGKSHAITLHEPVRFKQLDERRFSCSGTPADCVLYSITGAIPVKPDLVISGINRGPNLGTDIIYSGTAAVARQSALYRIPSIAVSTAEMKPPYAYTRAAEFVAKNLSEFIDHWSEDFFWNVNVPAGGKKSRVTFPSHREYRDKLNQFVHPNGDKYYFLTGDLVGAKPAKGSDYEAVANGDISISPVFLHPINHDREIGYTHIEFKE